MTREELYIDNETRMNHRGFDNPVKHGYINDPLTQEDRDSIMLFEAEESIKNDKNARPDWDFVRNSVFPVLDVHDMPQVTIEPKMLENFENKLQLKKEKREEHERRLKEDPVYAEEWKMKNEIFTSILMNDSDHLGSNFGYTI